MSDQEEDQVWSDLPREVKAVVYESLRASLVHHRKEQAMLAVLRNVLPPDPQGRLLPNELTHQIAAEAFGRAISQLESEDKEMCQTCHEYHDEDRDGDHKTVDPKDLS